MQNEDAQFGVLPFENSNAGDVSTVLDLLYTHPDIIIARMCDLPIRQDLLGVPGATLETVRTVISHPQALAQSSVFVQQHGFKTSTWGNTAWPKRSLSLWNPNFFSWAIRVVSTEGVAEESRHNAPCFQQR